jgi:elongation factor G
MMVPYREAPARSAVGERKYVRYFDGRGHFAHLQIEVLPRPGELPSINAAPGLELPADCYHAARAALFKKMERGPVRGFPLIGIQVRLLAATYLPAYSYPEAFAAVASMALDEAMIHASPIVLEPWAGLRLRVEEHSLSATLETLTKFLGSVRAEISLGDYFILDTEIPIRLKSRIASSLGLSRLGTRALGEAERYRPLLGPLSLTPHDKLEDWT